MSSKFIVVRGPVRAISVVAVFALAATISKPLPAATIAVSDTTSFVGVNAVCSIARAVDYVNNGAPTDGLNYCSYSGTFGVDDTIVFALGSGTPTITVSNNGVTYIEIPSLTKPVVIDGATGGATRIELVAGSGVTVPAWRVNAPSVVLKNLVVHGFPLASIQIGASGSATIQGNYLGTDVTGLLATTQNGYGIWVHGGSSVQIGGLAAGERNVISSNTFSGIWISAGASNVQVLGNYIGIGSDGLTPLGNCGDGTSTCAGIQIEEGSHDVTIASGNVIAANHGDGIRAAGTGNSGSDPYNVSIAGNLIGVGSDATTALGNAGAVGNSNCGVTVLTTSDVVQNSVGGSTPGSGNIVANNQYCGVLGVGDGTNGVAPTAVLDIEGNSMHDNGSIGIDLSTSIFGDGPTANDANGHDGGINLFQNYPGFGTKVTPARQLYISGTLTSPDTPFQTARIDVFGTLLGEAQGRQYLGAFEVATDILGNAAFGDEGPFTLPVSLPSVTTTATTLYGSSEFAPPLPIAFSSDIIFANSFDSQ